MTSASVFSGVPQFDREHQLAHDLARTRSDQRRADQHPALAVADQLERAPVEVVDVAARGLGRIGAGDDDVDASRARGGFRQPDRRDFRIGERHARDRCVIGPRVHAPQSPRDHLTVVVGEVCEPTESRDVTGTEDAGPRFERRRVHLQPAALRLCEPGRAPSLHVGAAARGHQQPVGRDHGSGLQVDDDGRAWARWLRGLLFDVDTGVPDHQRDAVRLEVWPERGSGLRFLEAKERRSGFDHGHLGAEAREGLPQLDTDGAPAQDRQRGRQLPRNRRLAVGPELDGVQAGDGWDRRGAAVGDHYGAARDELLAANRRPCAGPSASLRLGRAWPRSPPSRRPAGCRRGPVPSTARVWRPWESRRSIPRVTRRGRRARSASLKVSLERSRVLEGMHPQYGHSPPTSSRSTTASVSPLSRRPTAIASPATPPPRHTTSNSWGTSLPP